MNKIFYLGVCILLKCLFFILKFVYDSFKSLVKMAPKLKLTYFDIPGRAEVTRLMLHYGNVEFEDSRVYVEYVDFIVISPDFVRMRESGALPFQQLPLFQIDDTVLAQSEAIERWAARYVGLLPQDPLHAAQVDMTICALREVLDLTLDIKWQAKDEEHKQALNKNFMEQTLPRIFNGIEKYAGSTFLHGDEPTYADISLFAIVKTVLGPMLDTFDLSVFPKLQSSIENVGKLPTLAEYLKRYNN